MNLYICEKPSQAQDLAAVLGATKKGQGSLHNGSDTTITWAYGHLLDMFMPEDYDEKNKSWNLQNLPIAPDGWKHKVSPAEYKNKQYNVISALIKKARTVYISTDFDREGEAIARSLMDRAGYKGPVKRVCLSALDDASIRKALSNIKDGSETISLYHAALSRQRADWLIGMNLSRLYTVLAKQAGVSTTLHIGRVLTPTVALVCQRDSDIKNFVPSPFWVLSIGVSVQNGQFSARWIAPEECSDEEGRCTNKAFAEQVAAQIKNAPATISKAETKKGVESAPLPFDLTSLQQYASRRWGYTAQNVLDAAQSLYETHKATSYPRTDSRYLPESQRTDIHDVLQSLILSDSSVSGIVAGADPSRKSRAFNDAKVTAHHAIIPTPTRTDVSKMSEIERNLYDVIRRFYIAQFYSPYEFNRTVINVTCLEHLFATQGKTPLKQGWKVLFSSDQESAPEDDSDQSEETLEQNKLPKVNQGEPAQVIDAQLDGKMTRPSARFTEATLLGAMENIARYVNEEKFKKILKETAGLGTPATRGPTIEGAVERGYLARQKNVITATEKAHALMAVLPTAIKSAGMTAGWEQELEKIALGETDMNAFMVKITRWISNMIEQLKANSSTLTQKGGIFDQAFDSIGPPTTECFVCGGPARRIKGSKGFFWGCQNPSCKKTFQDNRGKPVDPTKVVEPPKNTPKCPECESHMLRRKSKPKEGKPSSSFWGCSSWPECKATKPIKSAAGRKKA